MARRGLDALLVLAVIAAAVCASCSAQAGPAVSLPSCPAAPVSLTPCIGYVFGVGSSASLASCCAQFKAFFQAQGPCLCAVSKLAPAPMGAFALLLGQAQAMIPNVCNLPTNPCDDVAGASTAPPATPLPPAAAMTAPSTTPAETPAAPATTLAPPATPADPEVSEAPPAATGSGSPAAGAAPRQVTPAGAESSTGSQVSSKMPELLHSAAGGRRSWEPVAGTVFITLFLAYVSAMYV